MASPRHRRREVSSIHRRRSGNCVGSNTRNSRPTPGRRPRTPQSLSPTPIRSRAGEIDFRAPGRLSSPRIFASLDVNARSTSLRNFFNSQSLCVIARRQRNGACADRFRGGRRKASRGSLFACTMRAHWKRGASRNAFWRLRPIGPWPCLDCPRRAAQTRNCAPWSARSPTSRIL